MTLFWRPPASVAACMIFVQGPHLRLDAGYEVRRHTLHHNFGKLAPTDLRHDRLQANAGKISLVLFLSRE